MKTDGKERIWNEDRKFFKSYWVVKVLPPAWLLELGHANTHNENLPALHAC